MALFILRSVIAFLLTLQFLYLFVSLSLGKDIGIIILELVQISSNASCLLLVT
ncbi:hypothetical protein BDN72DRAFT_200569 [Pluteus cervinus]|uniref:Uncharacterized protein n=1 Tax=Pluteus cervinus TaxID=181527 RepID=A0ACD3B5M1_9AGAR|nr:hypothetical protein BDN72DRAFT_200569 [Pluteus cervinus]